MLSYLRRSLFELSKSRVMRGHLLLRHLHFPSSALLQSFLKDISPSPWTYAAHFPWASQVGLLLAALGTA
jgi:hypothetical protein